MRRVVLVSLLVLILSLPHWLAAPPLAAVEAATPQDIEYSLPYPGLLPDSPLYIFKVLRDRVTLAVIRDPVKKAFYNLFLADKRLAAAEVLINSGKVGLGVTTVVQVEGYYARAVDGALSNLSKEKADELLSKLTVAGAKHAEVINSLTAKTTGKDFEQMQKAGQDNQNSRDRVMEVFLKK